MCLREMGLEKKGTHDNANVIIDAAETCERDAHAESAGEDQTWALGCVTSENIEREFTQPLPPSPMPGTERCKGGRR